MAAQEAVGSARGPVTSATAEGPSPEEPTDPVREREIHGEQAHLDLVYRRLEEKIHEAEFLMDDAGRRGQVGTPGALAERDAQVFRAGIHLNRLQNEFEDFLFGRIDLLQGKDGEKGPDGAYTAVEPAEGSIREDNTADIAETLHIGRIGVLDEDYTPLVIDWRAPAAAPFYRSTPVAPGRVVRRRVIRSKGRRVLGVEDDLMRPGLRARIDGEPLHAVGDGALMAALGQARSHTMRDIVSSIQAEQDMVIRAPAASVTHVEGGPGTGKTAVALHRAAYLLYQDRRRYSGGILIVSPTPLLVAYTEGVLPSLGEEGQVAIRAVGSLYEGPGHAEPTAYDPPDIARVKGSVRMAKVLRKAARAALEGPDAPERLRVVAFGRRLELEAADLRRIRATALGGTAPVNLLRPRARRLLLDALWQKSGAGKRHSDPELSAELRSGFDEDLLTEDSFTEFLDAWWPELGPREVLRFMGDERRLSRAARRELQHHELRALARSLDREELSVHDVALLDELQAVLGAPALPKKRRELDPLDALTGLEELMPQREESRRERSERLARERTEYAHVIVDEAQDLTPMQWRMIGRRGRHATWTVVGDPAQSSWPDPEEATVAREEALGSRPRRRFTLTVNYRNPAEVAELAAKVLARAMPGAESPRAVRSTGIAPRFAVAPRTDFARAVREEAARLLEQVRGTVGVIVAMDRRAEAAEALQELAAESPEEERDRLRGRVVVLGSLEAKGLEYDASLVVSPAEIAAGPAGRSSAGRNTAGRGPSGRNAGGNGSGGGRPRGNGADAGPGPASGTGLRVLYVALTRSTQQLTVLSFEADEPTAEGVPALLRD